VFAIKNVSCKQRRYFGRTMLFTPELNVFSPELDVVFLIFYGEKTSRAGVA